MRGRLLLLRPSSSCLSTPAADSPGVPPSAGAHQLFRGFSFVATGLMEDGKVKPAQPPLHSVVQVRNGDRGTALWRCRVAPGLQDLCTTWSLRQFSLEFLPPVVLSSPLTVTLCTGCQGSVGLWLCCPQVDLCWWEVCKCPWAGSATQRHRARCRQHWPTDLYLPCSPLLPLPTRRRSCGM